MIVLYMTDVLPYLREAGRGLDDALMRINRVFPGGSTCSSRERYAISYPKAL